MVKILVWCVCGMNLCKKGRRLPVEPYLSPAPHTQCHPFCPHCSSVISLRPWALQTVSVWCLCGRASAEGIARSILPRLTVSRAAQASMLVRWQGGTSVGLQSRKWRFVHDRSTDSPGPWTHPVSSLGGFPFARNLNLPAGNSFLH